MNGFRPSANNLSLINASPGPSGGASHWKGNNVQQKAKSGIFGYGIPAAFAFAFPIGLVIASLIALWSVASDSLSDGSPLTALIDLASERYIRRAIFFTLLQATLSALLSTLLAIPLARALASRDFPGRGAILSLFGAPFILPVIVAILGLIAIWGRNGLMAKASAAISLPELPFYGLFGILLAHVFFNLPLATRILLQGWLTIPSEHWRLAAQLGMKHAQVARHIEWPMLRERLPGIFALVFLLCATSFTVVLALGGGPKATTIELAIYQAIRFEFDLERAAILACIQILLCAGLALLFRTITKDHDTGQSLGGLINRQDRTSPLLRLLDGMVIALALAFLASPLLAAFGRGALSLMVHGVDLDAILMASLRSVSVSLGACTIMLLISLPLAQMSLHLKGKGRRIGELPGFAILVAPPIALGAGLFVMLHQHISVDDLALPLTSLLNGLQAVPFALIILSPAMARVERDYGRQILHLGMDRRAAIRLVHWPLMRRPLGLSLGIAAALSMGDLGVIALFGSPSEPTLPLYLYQQMGAYRMDQAYGSGLLLTLFAFAVFLLFDKGLGGRDQD
ncbi:thiamine/thiamine pyrophosphate ABC transporter permease ThiP [Cohaesibacter intestini]|uniref:thiamine/thiamine pyrophosphate ABC transporter permease ThiP n=1 Tax=Cohaesibacter intestini TaxID=2211145 RepID=UPI000DEA923D|nr:thiamine/thiamine pyrophosphate ABC transporter permease ThiP [Cohaesibacter intestini]